MATHVLPRLATISWASLVATTLLVGTITALVLDIVLWAGQRFEPPPVSFIQGQGVYASEMIYALAYAAMGWVLAARLWRNPLGWMFLAIGFTMALQMTITFLVQEVHQAFRVMDPLLLSAAWLSSTVHLPYLVVSFVFIFLLFPDGRPLSRRWAAIGWIALVGGLLVIAGIGASPEGLIWFPSLANPFAVHFSLEPLLLGLVSAGLALMVLGVVGSTASMVVRYRRAGDVQRAQLRWVAAAVLLLSICGLPFFVARYALQMPYAQGELLLMVALLAGGFLPVAAAIAVTRRRLYDIDVIINRALVYIPLTAILGGLYTAGVALFQRVFVAITGDRSDAAIIITTLVLASLFTPVRNSLQGVVDRRFRPSQAPAIELPPLIPADELRARLATLEERIAAMESGSDSARH